MRKHVKSIRGQLFIYYSTLVVVFFVASTAVTNRYVTRILTQRAEEALFVTVRSLANETDGRLREMNETSIRVAYSNLIKARFESYRTASEPASSHYDQQALRDIFIAIMGPLRSVFQLNLYDFSGTVVGAGHRNFTSAAQVQELPWHEATVALEGSRYTTVPYVHDEARRLVVSLCRVYYDNSNRPVGIIETVQEHKVLFSALYEFRDEPPGGFDGSRPYMIDDRNRLVFPPETDLSGYDVEFVSRALEYVDDPPAQNPYRYRREVVAFYTSPYSGWTIVVAQPLAGFRLPVQAFTRLVALMLLISLTLALGTSFVLARRLSLPIDRIHSAVKAIEITPESAPVPGAIVSEFNELEDLYQSFRQMETRLRRSTTELVAAKSQEMHARMLALQSQMNPHFLHNTLAIISVLAEEHETDDIILICDHISAMLRYIASDAAALVCLRDEIDHCTRYLELMKYRYEADIQYRIDVPVEMLGIHVPKLVVQPLVENTMKYGIHTPPPWYVAITGRIEDDRWTVTVADSGPGFHEERIRELRERMEASVGGRISTFLGMDGMGLVNIYTRLRILYAERAVFLFGNDEEGGARVEIGGILDKVGIGK